MSLQVMVDPRENVQNNWPISRSTVATVTSEMGPCWSLGCNTQVFINGHNSGLSKQNDKHRSTQFKNYNFFHQVLHDCELNDISLGLNNCPLGLLKYFWITFGTKLKLNSKGLTHLLRLAMVASGSNIWSRMKCLNSYWMNCHKLFYVCMVLRGWIVLILS